MPPPSHFSQAEELYHEALDRLAEGDAAGAAERLRRCLDLDSNMTDARHGLVRALQDAGDLDAALAEAQGLIQLEPDDVLAHTGLSIVYQRKGMIAEAEAEALRAKLLGWKKQLQEKKP